ncbi:MAG: tRNA uridine-5-carboxymethylaminomethyl(34) synthesis enzyme MnmG, partial [Angelakisella sp.]
MEQHQHLIVKQAEIVAVEAENGRVCAVVTAMGARYAVDGVVIATGTFLRGKIFVGEFTQESGPDGMHPSIALSDSLRALGISLRRFKTGTPARVLRRSIDFSLMEEQAGDEPIVPFSFETNPDSLRNTMVCHVAYTNENTHQVILDNIHRSPLYGGQIEGIGPRYCPSIEDKVKRFADKSRHQLFVEPMGADTEELYLQGMSSSLPEEVQVKMYRTIEGLSHVELMRTAYAIEYDCIDPTQLTPALAFKAVEGLFGAGQFNGTSGYEEAAAQGFVAGVNAAHRVLGREPLVLPRSGSYIGTLIDDLVTKGCMDPYRMMTSRSEYRLLLRQDNADLRLTPTGYELGLISEERYNRFLMEQQQKKDEIARLRRLSMAPTAELNAYLESIGTSPLAQAVRADDLLRRPQSGYGDLAPVDSERPA